MILHVARALAATMVALGTLSAIAATNYLYVDAGKGPLYPDWPAVAAFSAIALAGMFSLILIRPRVRRKN